ncbi:MAG: phytoene desaturase, partial [Myxococcales bacterium]|nr:phytoene desaturase [Myxococcales bacterium]
IRIRRRLGHRVLVLEARDQPGGRAGVFLRDGFSFDAGPTVITAPYLIDELFEAVGRDRRDYVELMPVDPFYRIDFHDGTHFDYVGDADRMTDQIRAFNPRDVDNYERLLVKVREIFDIGYVQLSDVPFDRLWDMMKVVPDLLRLGSFRSVYSMVANYIEDERLRQVFTFQPLLVGGNPFRVTSIYTLIHWLERKWGVYFARGGTHALVKGMVQLLEDVGAEVRFSAPVEEIEVEGRSAKAVRLASGERIPCSFVVSNADPSFVYTKLIDKKHRRTHTDGSVARRRQSMSLFVAYFGTKRTYPNLAHHTIILGPRYQGLLTDIFDRRVLADDFSLYLHAPTRSDPSLAPPGCENFYVLSPVPNNKSGIDWKAEGERYLERIYGELERRGIPGLRENLLTSMFVTPDYFQEELRSVDGAAFGLEPTLTQSAWFRYHNRSEDVDGLYFVGASTHPGAGIPGVLSTAKVMEKQVPRPAPGKEQTVPLLRRAAG